MILEVGKHERSPFYFDCFLSGYAREEEYLFMGGYAAMKITNIIHFLPSGFDIDSYDYRDYLQSMERFLSIFTDHYGKMPPLDDNEDIQSIKSLFDTAQNTEIPEYITKLFAIRRQNVKLLEINLIDFKRKSKIMTVNKICMNQSNDMVNFRFVTNSSK